MGFYLQTHKRFIMEYKGLLTMNILVISRTNLVFQVRDSAKNQLIYYRKCSKKI